MKYVFIDDIYSISSESNFDKIAFIDQSMYSQDNNPQKCFYSLFSKTQNGNRKIYKKSLFFQ